MSAGFFGLLEALGLWPSRPPLIVEHAGTVTLADSLRYTVVPVDTLRYSVTATDGLRYDVAIEGEA